MTGPNRVLAVGRRVPAALVRAAFFAALIVVGVLLLLPAEDLPETNVSDKLEHTAVFAVLGLLGRWAFPGRRDGRLLVFGLIGFGIACEVLQTWVPGRSASGLDAIADAAGVLLGFGVAAALR